MRRRQPATGYETPPPFDPVKSAIRQREVQLSDWKAVASLKSRWGLTADSLENWERFWRSNPAVRASSSPLSMGWVLETEDRIVGYLGSIPLLYRYGDRRLIATVATGFVMEPAFRGLGFRLIAAFYQQKNVDLFLNTTAIESVGRLTRAFRAEPLPQQDYETVLFWVFNARAFAKAVVNKFGMSGGIGCTARILGSAIVKTETTVSRRGPRRMKEGLRVTEGSLSEIGELFEVLWQKQLVGESRLLADRSPASLRWHFTIPGDRSETKVLCCRVGSELKGYAILRIVQDSGTGLIRCNLADLLVEKDDSGVAKSLLCAAFGVARKSGSHVFEVLGFPGEIRQILMRWKPYSRKYPACPFFFKARDPKFQALLAAQSAWYATPFDGDTTLMP
jgi:hypothetical protein